MTELLKIVGVVGFVSYFILFTRLFRELSQEHQLRYAAAAGRWPVFVEIFLIGGALFLPTQTLRMGFALTAFLVTLLQAYSQHRNLKALDFCQGSPSITRVLPLNQVTSAAQRGKVGVSRLASPLPKSPRAPHPCHRRPQRPPHQKKPVHRLRTGRA